MTIPDERKIEAQQKIDVLRRANAFSELLQTEGWKLVYALQESGVEKARKELRHVDTANVAGTIDAVQRWQIAENLLQVQADYINSTLNEAAEIQGVVTLEDALIMEQLHNEQSKSSGDSRGPEHPTGY